MELEKVLDNIFFDLDRGPYIGGSYLTHCIESQFYHPSWRPNDIDIICRNIDQLEYLDKKLGSDFEKKVVRPYENIVYYYWNRNDIKIQGILHNISAVQRIDFVDYTVSAFFSDNKNIISSKFSIQDVFERRLRFTKTKNELLVYYFINKDNPAKNAFERYEKYRQRGYKDYDNTVFNIIKKCEVE